MTYTHEAVLLAALCDSGEILGDEYDAIASLLRRFPELEAEVLEQARLNGIGAERELALMARVKAVEAERDQLRAWQQAAFAAHPNIDLDIEALTPSDQKGAA